MGKDEIEIKKTQSLRYFYEPKPNSIDDANTWNPNKATYNINADTLNERFNYSIQKSKDIYRIITLGDSFTYGLYVNTKDNWTERLEDNFNKNLLCKKINRFEVINLGVHGYDLQYSLERYKMRGIKYNPDLVLWFITDPNRIDEKLIPLSQYFTEQLKQSGEFDKLNIFEKYYGPWRMARDEIYKLLGEQGIYDYQKRSLKEMRSYYKNKLILLMEPWFNKKEEKAFTEFREEYNNVFFYNKIINTNNKNLHFEQDGHPNQKGHLAISGDIFNYLTRNKIIPCNK